jgi:hypothetical protein
LFLVVLEAEKTKIGAPADAVSGEDLFLIDVDFLLHLHMQNELTGFLKPFHEDEAPQMQPLNTSILEIRFQPMNFGRTHMFRL